MNTASLDPAAKGPDGLPIIFWTIKNFDMEGVRRLLDAGASIETPGFSGATPALSAAVVDAWAICLMLLERGANPVVADRRGFTIPWLASTSRANPNSEQGAALQRVRAFLNDRGLITHAYEPARVKQMVAQGNWPPR